MGPPREQFSAGLDATLPAELKSLAEAEGRDLQALIDETIAGLLARKAHMSGVQPDVAERLDESMTKYDGLYRKLAECPDI